MCKNAKEEDAELNGLHPLCLSETNAPLIEIGQVNNTEVQNLCYNSDLKQFFMKYKKKIEIEVEDYKPVPWKNITTSYKRKNGENVTYNYQYLTLFSPLNKPMRLRKEEIDAVVQFLPRPDGKFNMITNEPHTAKPRTEVHQNNREERHDEQLGDKH
jgi:hypothetical protein